MSTLGLSTKGYLDGVAGPGGNGPSIVSVVASNCLVIVEISQAIHLTEAGLDTHLWTITAPVGQAPVTPTGVSLHDSTHVYVTTTEQESGVVYRLLVPPGAVSTSGGDVNGELASYPFTGVGQPPYIVSHQVRSLTEIVVTFSEPVDQASALVSAHYVFDPVVTVRRVEALDETSYLLITTRQHPASIYQVTVDGVLDRAGNVI